jgi:hypothetical protein
MKIRSYNRIERAIIKHIMGVYPESLTINYQVTSAYRKALSEATKRGIAQAKLRRQAEQKVPSHE